MKLTYEGAGVDISEGNRAVDLMKGAVRSTYTPGVMGDIGLFSGGFSLGAFKDMEEPVLLASTDGVGTKVLVAQRMNCHNTVGIDLVAMCVNDLICQGATPLFFLDYIATGNLKGEKIATLVEGIAEGCRQGKCALIGGETAEMPGLYGEEEYDLAGFSVGIVDKKDIITGEDIGAEDVVVGLASTGLHSNGYSLARKLFFDHMGLKVEDRIPGLPGTVGEALLRPTKIYVKEILALLKKFPIKGIVNITGGGFYENIPRILPEGIGVTIEKGSWDLGDLFTVITETEAIDFHELYRSFNMGIGMAVIVDSSMGSQVVKTLEELGQRAWIIGETRKGKGVEFR